MRSFFFLFFWALWVGGANIIPQLYFLDKDALRKEEWISLLLTLGSIVSMLGIYSALKIQKALFSWSAYAVLSFQILLLILVCSAFALLFCFPSIEIYFASYLIFRFSSCLLFQCMDSLLVRRSAPPLVARHNTNSVLFMLLAMTFSPLFFSWFYSSVWVFCALVAMALVTALSFNWGSLTHLTDQPTANKGNLTSWHGTAEKSAISSRRWFLCFCGAYISVIYLTSSLLLYFVRDYYHFSSPHRAAGWIMLFTSASAFFAAAIYGKKAGYAKTSAYTERARGSTGGRTGDIEKLFFRRREHALILGLLIVSITLLYLNLFSSLAYVIFCTSIMGVSYGLFMVITRAYAGTREKNHGDGILNAYNNLPFISTIFVFSLAGLVKLLAREMAVDFYILLLFCVIAPLVLFASFVSGKLVRRGR